MKEYTQLTLPQRYEISVLHKVGQGPTQIARIVGVHRTTIARELKRKRRNNRRSKQKIRKAKLGSYDLIVVYLRAWRLLAGLGWDGLV